MWDDYEMERLWITEKPAMARNLAAGLVLAYGVKITNESTARDDGCIDLSNGDRIAHLIGHMIQSVKPQAYIKPEHQEGSYFAFLPLVPDKLLKEPVPDFDANGKVKLNKDKAPIPRKQLVRVMKWIKQAKEIVNAGDTDREGQLIVDELLEYTGVDPEGRDKPVRRIPLESPKAEDIAKLVRKGFESNSDKKWVQKRLAALSRSEVDWCLGMSCSMAWQEITGYKYLSIGRVQTCILNMVVTRDEAIDNFKSIQYFVPVITLADGTDMRWESREGAEGSPGFDSEGRIISREVAKAMVERISRGLSGTINLAEIEKKKQLAPLPFSLGTLQATAASRHGMTLQEVTAAAQSLYQKQSITYVGTDCQFLPTSMLEQAHDTMANLSRLYNKVANGSNLDLRSKAWNDEKTEEHSGIIPTGTLPTGATEHEKAVFNTISHRYMAQFYPAHEFVRHHLGAVFGTDSFKSVRKEVTVNGWKDAESNSETEEDSGDSIGEEVEIRADKQKTK